VQTLRFGTQSTQVVTPGLGVRRQGNGLIRSGQADAAVTGARHSCGKCCLAGKHFRWA